METVNKYNELSFKPNLSENERMRALSSADVFVCTIILSPASKTCKINLM